VEARRLAVPEAIAPAVALLDSLLPATTRDSLRTILPDNAMALHMSLGMWLRGEAGLWKGGEVADSLQAHGLTHPDDMSHVILQAYGLYLNGRPIDLDSLIRTRPPAPSGFKTFAPPAHEPNRAP
jgi:hypothetical protein